MTRFYDCKAWKQARRAQLDREPFCRLCAAVGRRSLARVVDHITPINAGGAELDHENLQSLCKTCHDSVKQRLDKGAPVGGCDASGAPLDTGHHWWSDK